MRRMLGDNLQQHWFCATQNHKVCLGVSLPNTAARILHTSDANHGTHPEAASPSPSFASPSPSFASPSPSFAAGSSSPVLSPWHGPATNSVQIAQFPAATKYVAAMSNQWLPSYTARHTWLHNKHSFVNDKHRSLIPNRSDTVHITSRSIKPY